MISYNKQFYDLFLIKAGVLSFRFNRLSNTNRLFNSDKKTGHKIESNMDLSTIRHNYQTKDNLFLEQDIKTKEPFDLFDQWFSLIKNSSEVVEPNAMCLSTANKDGFPSARFVLCKGYSKAGFRFFTHYTSRKGLELAENPHCALTFYWPHCNRSVRIEGVAERLPFSHADEYFSGRPYQSQIGALCSDQSKPVPSRETLSKAEQELQAKYGAGQVPRPPQWGGYLVKPVSIEFWQGQTDRIHDRIRFRKPKETDKVDGVLLHQGQDGWVYERLAP